MSGARLKAAEDTAIVIALEVQNGRLDRESIQLDVSHYGLTSRDDTIYMYGPRM